MQHLAPSPLAKRAPHSPTQLTARETTAFSTTPCATARAASPPPLSPAPPPSAYARPSARRRQGTAAGHAGAAHPLACLGLCNSKTHSQYLTFPQDNRPPRTRSRVRTQRELQRPSPHRPHNDVHYRRDPQRRNVEAWLGQPGSLHRTHRAPL
ncbi:hypothetical protein SCP_1800050 [Sparassis crispa]|uniref:Uncharacterized protein n=1 Tax=Sparassis crispa TaxID=139825 RepID=A0A401H6I3_9APHY|nr:hypothetical protein SCP_1800050 [Sparassis crispa]GBE89983.1 hypothetical protein SCP_1800050 [Sparassis crispa]